MKKSTIWTIALALGLTAASAFGQSRRYQHTSLPGVRSGPKAKFTSEQLALYSKANQAKNHGRAQEAYALYQQVIELGEAQPRSPLGSPGYRLHPDMISPEDYPDASIMDDAQMSIANLLEYNLRHNEQKCTPEKLKKYAAEVRDAYAKVWQYGDSNNKRKAKQNADRISEKYEIDHIMFRN